MNIKNTTLVNLIDPIKQSANQQVYLGNKWESSYIKKFVTQKWPYEQYKNSIVEDFWLVLSTIN